MNQKAAKKNLLMFPLGTVGRDMIYQLFTNYLLTYILFTRKLTPAMLATITAIMIGARVFDALNDPIMGNIIDRTRTKHGKFKPWLVIGILTTSIVIFLTFNLRLEGWAFIAFFGVMYFLYSITYTMHDIAYWGMVPSLGTDAHMRDQLTSRANLFAGVGGTLASVLIPIFTVGAMTLGGSTQTAYGIVALVIALLGPLFLCFTVFGVKEDRSYEKQPAPKVSLKKVFSVIKKNDQLIWIAVIFLIQQVGQNICLNGLGQMYVYFDYGYQGGFWGLFTTLGLIPTAVLMLFYPAIIKRTTRKAFMLKMLIVGAIGYLMMFFVGAFVPATVGVKFYLFTVGYMAANFGFYAYYLIMMISILNTVEYNEYKNGERDDAIIASVRPFVTKFGSAVCVAIVNLSYVIFGVLQYTNEISALEQDASVGLLTEEQKSAAIEGVLTHVQSGQKIGMLIFITLVPFIFMLVSYLLYKKKYMLDETKYAEICAELEARKNQ